MMKSEKIQIDTIILDSIFYKANESIWSYFCLF